VGPPTLPCEMRDGGKKKQKGPCSYKVKSFRVIPYSCPICHPA
jgi:hypothetical protein